MTDQPTGDPIGDTTPETAHALLWRHGLPEDVIDGALALFAQELAGKIRAHRDHTRGAVQATKVMDFAADLISPEHWARTVPVVQVSSPPPDQTALRDRIRRVLCDHDGKDYLWGTDMLEPDEYGELADAVLAVLPPPADRAAVNAVQCLLLRAADLVAERASDLWAPGSKAHAEMLGDAALLRRLAAEAQRPFESTPDCHTGPKAAPKAAEARQPDTGHSCSNCDGIDPGSCLMNPDRPPEQCPRSEFDGYGLQCQKPAGHNLCTFEEQPAPVHKGGNADDCPA